MYDYPVLQALGEQAPAGMIAWDRAPFWTVSTPAMQSFASRFNSAYGSYPNEFAIIGYTAVQGWEYAVRQAKSFATDQVVAALAGATVPTIRGDITVRACDHQAEVPGHRHDRRDAERAVRGAALDERVHRPAGADPVTVP